MADHPSTAPYSLAPPLNPYHFHAFGVGHLHLQTRHRRSPPLATASPRHTFAHLHTSDHQHTIMHPVSYHTVSLEAGTALHPSFTPHATLPPILITSPLSSHASHSLWAPPVVSSPHLVHVSFSSLPLFGLFVVGCTLISISQRERSNYSIPVYTGYRYHAIQKHFRRIMRVEWV